MDPLTGILLASPRRLFGAAADPAELRSLLCELGIELPDAGSLGPDGPLGGVLESLAELADGVEALRSSFDDGPDLAESLALVASVPDVVGDVLAAARALEDAPELLGQADLPDELRDPALWQAALDRLPGVLVAQALEREAPGLYAVLRLLGAVDVGSTAAAGELRWSALPAAAADPAGAIAAELGWSAGEIDVDALGELMFAVADAVGLPLSGGTTDGDPASPLAYELRLASGELPGVGFVESGVVVEPLEDEDGGVSGLALEPYSLGAAPQRIELGDGRYVEVGQAGEPTRLVLRPGAPPRVEGPGPGLDLAIGAAFATPRTVLGVPGLGVSARGFRLAGRYVDGAVEVELGTSPGLDLGLSLGGDGFLRALLGSGATVTVDAGLIWRQAEPLRFLGSTDLSIKLPLAIAIGPITVERIEASVELADPIEASVTASVGAALGPLEFVVEGVGLAAELVAVDGAPLSPSVRVLPPTGLGLAIDAGAVTGGGYLEHEPEIGRYAGAAELELLGTGLTAVGVVTTQLPGGEAGWSMFLSLGIRLSGVQLGFGFTLNGVGGLVGVNRGLDDDALGDAVRAGSLGAILFPDDPIADAPQILADIDSVFPAADGQYVFGPVVKIGWGTPTLVELDVGVAVQLPEPLTISLLGALNAVLPREDVDVLVLHVEFAATVNLTEGTLKVDASLSGSEVAGLAITGDMAVRADFLGEPTFLVAFGGFHPAFDPPADFPALERVGVALDTGDELRVSLGGYFALTSNTVQFGAAAELYAEQSGFSAEGGTSFDALIIFKPFGFDVALAVWFSVSAGNNELLGVLLSGRLTGPNPWHAVGEAEFRILGIKTRLEVEASFGDRSGEPPPASVDVGALLREELEREDAWSALSPTGATPVIVTDPDDSLTVDPSGRIQVLQRIVPLERTIEVYGNAQPSGGDQFTLSAVGFAADDVEGVDDYFAGAHYFRLDEDEKLSAPSFSLMKAGLVLGGSGVDAPAARELTYDHETAYRDPNGVAEEHPNRLYRATDESLTRALAVLDGAGATEQTSFAVSEPTYFVADGDTGVATGAPEDFFAARASRGAGGVVTPEYELELRS